MNGFPKGVLLLTAVLVASALPTYLFAATPPRAVPVSNGTLFSTFSGGKTYTCFTTSSGNTSSGKLIGASHFISFKSLKSNATKSAKTATGTKRSKFLKKASGFAASAKSGDPICRSAGGGIVPTPQPTLPTGGNCYFDTSGNVTAYGKSLLGIPSSSNPTVAEGRALWESSCVGCHSESGRQSRTVSQYRAATAQEPMYYDEFTLPNEQLYRITVFLNRYRPAC